MTGWVRVTGGYHRCGGCGAFRAATSAAPFWLHYRGAVASDHRCQGCAEARS